MASATDSNRISSLSDCQKIWEEYRQTGGILLRNMLIEFYLPVVKYNAKKIKAKLPAHIELDDLVSAGVFGLIDAINSFDFSYEVKFESFCVLRIRGAMLDELRRMDWVPRKVRLWAQKYQQVVTELRYRDNDGNEHKPSIEDIAEHLGISLKEAKKIYDAGNVSVMHFCQIADLPRGEDGQDRSGFVYSGSLADPKSLRPDDELSENVEFNELISFLSDQEQVIVTLYYRDDYKMHKIGRILGLSESRVFQIIDSALQKIKDSIVL